MSAIVIASKFDIKACVAMLQAAKTVADLTAARETLNELISDVSPLCRYVARSTSTGIEVVYWELGSAKDFIGDWCEANISAFRANQNDVGTDCCDECDILNLTLFKIDGWFMVHLPPRIHKLELANISIKGLRASIESKKSKPSLVSFF